MDKKELENKDLLSLYHSYLLQRSILGDIYRDFWLYPKLSGQLEGRTLDIGCGTGKFLKYRPNTVGIDVNRFNVEFCTSQKLEAYHVGGHWPFPDASFDSALMDNVLEHVEEPDELLRETHRILKKHGILLIGVPGPAGYAWDSDHKVYYSEKKLVRTLLANGFQSKNIFHMPLRSRFLERRLKQYCYFMTFVKQ